MMNRQANIAYVPMPGTLPSASRPEWSPAVRQVALRNLASLGRDTTPVLDFFAQIWRMLTSGTPRRVLLNMSPAVLRDMGLPETQAYDRYMDAFRGGSL